VEEACFQTDSAKQKATAERFVYLGEGIIELGTWMQYGLRGLNPKNMEQDSKAIFSSSSSFRTMHRVLLI
jgi:hypothetical protein